MSALANFIQHSSGSPSHDNQRINKRNPNWKRKELSLFADDMILYTENPKNTTRKLLELNEPGKVVRYKINTLLHFNGASQVALVVKNLPANAGDVKRSSLGQEDPLEEGMATHSTTLAWRISWTEKTGGLQSMGLQRVRHD